MSNQLYCVKSLALQSICYIGSKLNAEKYCDDENIKNGFARYFVERYSLKKSLIINPALPPVLVVPPKLKLTNRIGVGFENPVIINDNTLDELEKHWGKHKTNKIVIIDDVKSRVKNYLKKFNKTT